MLEPQDVCQLLGPEDLLVLRRGFRRAVLSRAAHAVCVGPYAAAAPAVEGWLGLFYEQGALLEPAQRELVLNALLAAEGHRREVAIHVYWGLMEGLGPEQLAATFLLIGMYAGIDAYRSAIRVMQSVCRTLRELAATGGVAVETENVIRELGRQDLLPT
ncbi:MAG TPA: carboxymuconolactone decarboxylase family protein [Polyangia bacterium]|nr:carboxymuconolactone decarboxylase family protein [Polyangia bacterium]